MPGIVIVGLQWGDEGKGKISYLLSRDADCVVRFQGGANAGHTVVIEGRKLKFNILPAGSAAGARPCIASGTVVDLDEVFEELEMLRSMGLEARLMISRSASVVLPIHKKLDSRIEEARGGSAVGTTRRGIGPTYSDKALRTGLRIEDLLNPDDLRERLEILKRLHGEEPDDFENLRRIGEKIAPYVGDVELYVNDVLDEGGKVVFEGAQGTLLDIDHGTYPYVTSSNTIAGAACTGCGVGPTRISAVVGVAKAYTTRVGAGVFPTEVGGELGERLREVGQEYGTTTGRPRRVGWLDIPLLRYAIRVSNVDWIALTKLDVLSGLDKIRICVEYEYDGRALEIAPPAVRLLSKVKPVYEEVKGWGKIFEDEWRRIAKRGWEALPDEAKAYVELLEDLLSKPIKLISIGADAGMEVEK
jgi:adenylosuccinate synthase